VISAVIMGSPVRRLINPITRCWDKPHNRYAGTDDGLGTGRKLDKKTTHADERTCRNGIGALSGRRQESLR
jgi:hypothetical protein